MALISRMSSAFVRMVLVMLLILLPSLLLHSTPDARQIMAMLAVFGGALVLAEYAAKYPSLTEFRDAPPFNRLRYLLLLMVVLLLTLMERGDIYPSTLSQLLRETGALIGTAIDFPFSPVRLMLRAVSGSAGPPDLHRLLCAAGVSGLVSLVMLAVFVICLRLTGWPGRGTSFNVWINLPTFDPTAGRDVVCRLERDAKVNILLGLLLPFLIPVVLGAASGDLARVIAGQPQLRIWVMAAWSFLPASLFMRAIAMNRIAALIGAQRREAAAEEAAAGFQPG